MDADFPNLEEELRKTKEEADALRQKLKNAVKKGKTIEEDREKLQRRISELEQALATQNDSNSSEKATRRLETTVAEYKEKLRSAIKKGKGIEDERNALAARVKALEGIKDKGSPDGMSAADFEAKLEDAVERGRRAEAEKQRLEAELAEAREQLKDAEERGTAAKALRDEAAVQREALQAAAARISESEEARRAADERGRQVGRRSGHARREAFLLAGERVGLGKGA
mmetsp:Transcript_2351/g.5554  ORF Transcript_2351/g.5554 Transcript_2351/m.5554 type:complete len:228 (+) Transcript_2351:134-817(+)